MKPRLIAGLSVALVFSVTATSLAGFIAKSSRKDNPALPIHDFVRDFGPDLP